jgi:protein subunit release factor A
MQIPDHQIRVTVERDREDGMRAGLNVPGVLVEHIPSQLCAAARSERSALKNRQLAIDMIAWGLVCSGWTQADIDRLDELVMATDYGTHLRHPSSLYATRD